MSVINSNDRQQPIYDARLFWYNNGEPYGTQNPEFLGTVLKEKQRFRDYLPGSDPNACGAILTFRDAANATWIRTADGRLMRRDSDIAADLAKILLADLGAIPPLV